MNHLALAAITLSLLLSSCGDEGQLVTSEPRILEVVGRYRLTYWSFGSKVDSEVRSKANEAYIELKADGTAVLHEVPVVPESEDRKFAVQGFRSASGTFSISPLGGTGSSDFYGLYLRCGTLPDPMDGPRLRRRGNALCLSVEYFDGDFIQRMLFTRDTK